MNNKEVKKDRQKGVAILLSGWLFALMGFLSTLNIHFEWLTEESINAFVAFVVATVILIGTAWPVWKNTFVSKKAQELNSELYARRKK